MTLLRRGCLNTWLALVAVSLQLALSWGHIHLPEHQRVHPAADVSGGKGDRSASTGQGGHDPADGTDASCLVCWAMRLASSGLVAAPLPVPHPVEIGLLLAASVNEDSPPSREVAPFDARAPPLTGLA